MAANRIGIVAFWILVAAIVGARATMFHPDPFASFLHADDIAPVRP